VVNAVTIEADEVVDVVVDRRVNRRRGRRKRILLI
jgi:hypothetical protein